MRAVPHSYTEVNWLWQSCWAPHDHFQHYFHGKRHFQKWITAFWNTTSQQVAGNWVGGTVTRSCSQWTIRHHGQLFPDHWINFNSKEKEGRRRRRWGEKQWSGNACRHTQEEGRAGRGQRERKDAFSLGRHLWGSPTRWLDEYFSLKKIK